MPEKLNGWNEWAKYILGKLEEHDRKHESHFDRENKMHVEMAAMKARAGVIGAIAGVVFGGIMSIATAIVLWLVGVK